MHGILEIPCFLHIFEVLESMVCGNLQEVTPHHAYMQLQFQGKSVQ